MMRILNVVEISGRKRLEESSLTIFKSFSRQNSLHHVSFSLKSVPLSGLFNSFYFLNFQCLRIPHLLLKHRSLLFELLALLV